MNSVKKHSIRLRSTYPTC